MAVTTAPSPQQLYSDQTQTATAAGTATFIFPVAAQGETWTGTLVCQTAPLTAEFFAVIGATAAVAQGMGTPWGTWGGTSIGGPVQTTNGQALGVTATGLTPGQAFTMSWRGWSESNTTAQLVYPEPTSSSVIAATVPAIAQTVFGPSSVNSGSAALILVPSSVRTLVFTITVPNGDTLSLLQVGVTNHLGIIEPIFYNAPAYLPSFVSPIVLPPTIYTVVVPIPGLLPVLNNAVNFTVTTAAASASIVQVFGDTQQYQEAEFYNGPVVAFTHTNTTATTTTIVNGPQRLLTASLEVFSPAASSLAASLLIAGTAITRIDVGNSQFFVSNLNFPPNTILESGQALAISTGALVGTAFAVGAVTCAYP